jgi:hypothetical protein
VIVDVRVVMLDVVLKEATGQSQGLLKAFEC